jgi:hypothetical protein
MLEMADAIYACGIEFVEPIGPMNNKRGFGTKFIEDVRKRLDKGQYEQAMRDLEEMLEEDPTDEAAADLYERLRQAHGVVEE